MNNLEISIVTPMHNESLSATEFVKQTHSVLSRLSTTFEIVIVNDGSTDTTEDILESLTDRYPELRVISLSRNCGQWAAIYAGLQQSKGKYVVVMDGDLQHDPADIPALISKIKEGFVLVSGARYKRENANESFLLRRFPSKVANYLLRVSTHCPTKDMGGYKCIEGKMARQLHLSAGQHRLLPALVWMRGGSVAEIPVSSNPRFAGESHYGFSRSFDVIFDIILFGFENSFKSRPIYLFGRLSVLFFIVSFLLFLWVLYDKFFIGHSMTDRPPFFISLIGFLISFGFLSLGFLLEMIVKLKKESSESKPYYIRREISNNSHIV
jgi:glycosyltransferase involved in cell wall biosynthesis